MKTIAMLVLLITALGVSAQEKVVRLYDGLAPGSENWKQQEKENNNNLWKTRIIYNVTTPTLTVFPADPVTANGTAIIICPGGGFQALSIDSEGFDVARWLASKGVACFVLKYRLIESKTNDPTTEMIAKGPKMEADAKPVVKLAVADGSAAIAYVRKHASEYGVKPDRVGIIGFSAGGTVSASTAFTYTAESRPDFVANIYLAYDGVIKDKVPADAPPMFILAASDDHLGLAPHSIRIYNDWTAAKKSTELHMLANGGHGFGMKKQNLPSDHWIELFGSWLSGLGLMTKV